MTNKQLQVYGARIRLAWFRAAEELGSVTAACKYYGIARSEYYYSLEIIVGEIIRHGLFLTYN